MSCFDLIIIISCFAFMVFVVVDKIKNGRKIKSSCKHCCKVCINKMEKIKKLKNSLKK